jgi:RNA polymerase sigma factor (sigma-70 family)
MNEGQTTQLQTLIDRLKAGDASAKDELIDCAYKRLVRLTSKMLKSYRGVARWEWTDDVFQNAALRLCRALNDTTPESVKHFLNLAALHIRRELIDLARHHSGPQSAGAHHDTGKDRSERPIDVAAETTSAPGKLVRWTEFHEHVHALPTGEREIFSLLWYHGMSQSEVATLLNLSERTLQRRWQAVRLKIFQAMKGELPE